MNPTLVRWQVNNATVPMIAIGPDLICTNKQLYLGLGTTRQQLNDCYTAHRKELEGLRYGKPLPKEFLHEHKAELGIDRLKKDMVFWTEHAMLSFGFWIRNPTAEIFRTELREFIVQHRKVTLVTKTEYHELEKELLNKNLELAASRAQVGRLEGRLDVMEEKLSQVMPFMDQFASLAGISLNLQKGTKNLRLVN